MCAEADVVQGRALHGLDGHRRASRMAELDGLPRRDGARRSHGRHEGPAPEAQLLYDLERGRGRSAVPVRPALVGAVVGVIGVVAVSLFSHGVNDASTHPERFGKTYRWTEHKKIYTSLVARLLGA